MAKFSPRLIHKLLALVAVPLLFEVVFAATLFALIRDAELAGEREHRAREAVASLNSIYEHIMDGSKVAGVVLFGKADSPQFQKFHQVTETIPDDLQNIREQLQDDRDAIPQVDALDKNISVTLRIMDEVFDQMQSGNRMGALQHLRDVKSALVDVSNQLMTLRESCNRQADENFDAQRLGRRRARSLIIGGIVVNILTALGLWLFVNRNITSRLAVVMANTHKLAGNQPLLPDVSGTDEIRHLDKVFKDMATALEMAKKKERAVIETMPAGLVITDHRGIIQMTNPTMTKMLGREIGAFDFKPLSTVFNGDHKADDAEFETTAQKSAAKIIEKEGLCADGTKLPMDVSSTLYNVFGDDYYLFVMLDVRERKQIERMKQEFVSMISHDLRTPLTSIQVFLGMLSQGMYGNVGESVQKKASMADRNASRLIGLINDLLDIDKMESGQLKLECGELELHSVIDRSIESVKPFADKSNIAIDVTPAGGIRVFADGDRLVQVLINLLGNAVKFSPAGSTIEIAAETADSTVLVKIVDHGRGVPDELKESIFERFKQVEAKDATEKKGTGLGLAICRAIVEQHGGKIGVETTAGGGSTFWFALPSTQSVSLKEHATV